MPPDTRYLVEGITPLRGEIAISGAKNAALPCMCAALLTQEEVTLRNVPDIADVRSLLEIFSYIGVEHLFENGVLHIRADKISYKKIPHTLVKKLRASILLLGPLLARFGEVELAYPGGDVIGKRPVDAHIDAFVQMGAENCSTEEVLHLKGRLKSGEVVLPEFSVTATENALMAASASRMDISLHIAAAEPHVQNLCALLKAMGADIDGVRSHDLFVKGSSLHGADHTITTDYLEAGFFALAGIITGGDLTIRGAKYDQLRSFFKGLDRFGASWEFIGDAMLHVCGGARLTGTRIQTNIFPGFPSDLQPAIGVMMTQAHGVSRIHEFLYEGRFGYLYELEKMGANIEILNAREALIIGPTPLKGRTVASNDIRAGTAMVLAALCSRGSTLITDVQYIERGYERLPEKLRSLGASIERCAGDALDSTHDQDQVTGRQDVFIRERSGVAASVS